MALRANADAGLALRVGPLDIRAGQPRLAEELQELLQRVASTRTIHREELERAELRPVQAEGLQYAAAGGLRLVGNAAHVRLAGRDRGVFVDRAEARFLPAETDAQPFDVDLLDLDRLGGGSATSWIVFGPVLLLRLLGVGFLGLEELQHDPLGLSFPTCTSWMSNTVERPAGRPPLPCRR